MKRVSFAGMACPIARTLEVVGEWWTLLIVRDALMGQTRFEGFQSSLGIARNVLTARLEMLVEKGVLARRRYRDRPPRDEYVLTEKGRALFPVLLTLKAWGERWEGAPAVALVDRATGRPLEPCLVDRRTGAPIGPETVRAVSPGPLTTRTSAARRRPARRLDRPAP